MYVVVIRNKENGKSFPLIFSNYGSAADYMESAFTSDDYDKLEIVLTVIGEEQE